jgi:hypothetical protein
MPIVLELLVLLLVTYAAGLAIGWVFWGRGQAGTETDDDG